MKRAGTMIMASFKKLKAQGMIDEESFRSYLESFNSQANELYKTARKANFDQKSVAAYGVFAQSAYGASTLVSLATVSALSRDVVTLARLRGVSKLIQAFVDNVILLQFDYGTYDKDAITYPRIAGELSGFRFAGLHGTSSNYGPSLYKGLKVPDASQVNYKTSQLGPGFYLTDGDNDPMGVQYAKSVADLGVKNAGGKPALFRIMLHNRGTLTSSEVPEDHWNDMAHDKVNPLLQQHMVSDLMTSEIVDNEPVRQIKVNSGAFGSVMVLPPVFSGDNTVDWIEARFKRPDKFKKK